MIRYLTNRGRALPHVGTALRAVSTRCFLNYHQTTVANCGEPAVNSVSRMDRNLIPPPPRPLLS
jgi:hypothetical protein